MCRVIERERWMYSDFFAVLLLLYADRFRINMVVALIIKTIFSLNSFACILLLTLEFFHFSHPFSILIRRYFYADLCGIDCKSYD